MSFVLMNMKIPRFCRLREILISARRITSAASSEHTVIYSLLRNYVKQITYKTVKQRHCEAPSSFTDSLHTTLGHDNCWRQNSGAVGCYVSLTPKEQWHQFLLSLGQTGRRPQQDTKLAKAWASAKNWDPLSWPHLFNAFLTLGPGMTTWPEGPRACFLPLRNKKAGW